MKNNSPIVKIAKKVCPAVITIVVSKDLPKIDGFYTMPFGGKELIFPKIKDGGAKELTKIGGGSGFIISPDGTIVTSCHVVEDLEADYTVILEPEKKYPAQILARDRTNDIAVLKIEGEKFPFIELGNSEKIELGEEVIAIGNALGEFQDTVSAGIVSGLSRLIQPTNNFGQQTESLRGLIQTDAAINPGNSGGPLVNMEGKVIGINTAVVMGAQNIGFAIPINYVRKDLEEVKKYGKLKIPFLGVKYIILNKEISEKNKLPVDYGALIIREVLGESAVIANSPAEKAGLKEFDIILEARGEKITAENSLANILQKCKPDEEIELKTLKDKAENLLKIKLEEKK
jgi:S1-C subfamily serine protease